MSTRRIVIGQISGQADMRVARPGYWADVDDVNDRRKISFAASRGRQGVVKEAGFVGAADVWFNFTQAYPGIPSIIFAMNQGGTSSSHFVRHYQNINSDNCDATVYVAVVEQGRMMFTNPARVFHAFPEGENFNYMVAG